MTEDDVRTAFQAGFYAGFWSSREGFNGECAFSHLAPALFENIEDILTAALRAYVEGAESFNQFYRQIECR